MAKTDTKAILAAVVKYHFWMLCTLALAVGLGCWSCATSDLGAQYDRRASKLKGDFTTVQGIAGEQDHPNEKVLQRVKEKQALQDKNVRAAWIYLYNQQEKKNPWPENLGDEFLTMIRVLKPTDEIPETHRFIYSNFLRPYFPTLMKIVKARAAVAPAAGGAAGDPAAPAPVVPVANESEWIVEWVDSSRLEKWPARWSMTPSSFEVRLCQEDLWVYEALLRIIAATNASATSHENAAIKRIEALEIGTDAAGSWSKGDPTLAHIASRASQEGESGVAAPEAGGEPPAPGEEGAAPAGPQLTKEMKDLLNNRYMDDKGRPLPAERSGPYPQYKMMPIHMRLSMDQMKIPDLMVACATSNMPIEVRQVRLGVAGGGAMSAVPGAAGAAPAVEGGGAGAGLAPGGGGGHAAGDVVVRSGDVNSMDLMVDLYGIISIYNPPPEEPPPPKADEAPPAEGAAPNPDGSQPERPAGEPAPAADAPKPAPEAKPADAAEGGAQP